MKVYLASPFFNKKEKEVKEKVRQRIVELGWELYDPQAPSANSVAWEQTNSDWGIDTFRKDCVAILDCDYVVAIDWGLYGDCGTAWEIGAAYALDKPALVLVPDETFTIPHSLMVVNGAKNCIAVSRFLTDDNAEFFLDDDYYISEHNEIIKPHFLYGIEQK